jgi:hypothetical protein
VEVCVWCLREGCVRSLSEMSLCLVIPGPLLVGLSMSPFYSFQGEGSGYICGKKDKIGKDEREKQKRWPRVWASSSLSGGSSSPIAWTRTGR